MNNQSLMAAGWIKALTGMKLAPLTTVRLQEGTRIVRYTGTPMKTAEPPRPEDFKTADAYYEARDQHCPLVPERIRKGYQRIEELRGRGLKPPKRLVRELSKFGESLPGARLTAGIRTGCWWMWPGDLYALKADSVTWNKDLTHVARKALAVGASWSKMNVLLVARVRAAEGLWAYAAPGKEVVDINTSDELLIPDPSIQQLYIPGLGDPKNVARWLALEEELQFGS